MNNIKLLQSSKKEVFLNSFFIIDKTDKTCLGILMPKGVSNRVIKDYVFR